MSTQTFKPAHRHAIWKAYDYKCFYCHGPLSWDDLRIDHVVPESLSGKPRELECILRDLGLESAWSLQADHNFVAACDTCNRRKRDLVPPRNQAILWLTEASNRSAKIGELRAGFERERQASIVRVQLETAIACGWIDEATVKAAFNTRHDSSSLIALTTSIEFLDGVTLDALRPGEVEDLFDKGVMMGADVPEGLELVHDDGSKRYVKTCREYSKAIEDGFYALTTFAMKMEAFFQTLCGIVQAMAACRPAAESFIECPRVGLYDVGLLPTQLISYYGEEGSDELQALETNDTVGELIEKGLIKIVRVNSSMIELEMSYQRILMRELFRADLDGDGTEDILISRYNYMIGGTLGFGSNPVAIGRKSQNEKFEIVEIQPSRGAQSTE